MKKDERFMDITRGILMKVSEKIYLSIEEIISLPTVLSTNISDDGKM